MKKEKLFLSTMADIVLAEMDENGMVESVGAGGNVTAPLARKYGLGLELAEFCAPTNLDRDFEQTDAAIRDKIKGIRERTLHAPYNELSPAAIDPLATDLANFRYTQALERSLAYGVNKIVIHSGFVPTVYFKEWFLERSVQFWKHFLEKNPGTYLICLENVMEDGPELLRQLAERLDDSRFRLCLDVGHANVSETPVEVWLEALAPWIAHFHIHNNYGERDTHEPLGKGSLDMTGLLERCEELCPEATYTIECMDPAACLDWMLARGILER